MQTLQSHTDKVSCCVWSRDDRQLLSAGNDKAVKLWDVQVRSSPPHRQKRMFSVAIGFTNPLDGWVTCRLGHCSRHSSDIAMQSFALDGSQTESDLYQEVKRTYFLWYGIIGSALHQMCGGKLCWRLIGARALFIRQHLEMSSVRGNTLCETWLYPMMARCWWLCWAQSFA